MFTSEFQRFQLPKRRFLPFALLLSCLLLGSFIAKASEPVIQAQAVSRILGSGKKLQVQIDFTFPENRCFTAYTLAAYLPYVPKNFSESSGIPINHNRDPRWSSVRLSEFKWFPQKILQPGELLLEFDTASWPAGDYKLELRGLFRELKSSVDTDIYKSAYFYLTIVDP